MCAASLCSKLHEVLQPKINSQGVSSCFKNPVNPQSHFVPAYDSADPAHPVEIRCTPWGPLRQACRSCGRSHVTLLVVAAAATSDACPFFVAVGVVSGTQSRQIAGVPPDGRLVRIVLVALLVVEV